MKLPALICSLKVSSKTLIFPIFLFLSLSFLALGLVWTKKAQAQVPNPTVPCDEFSPNLNPFVGPIRTDPEFHTFRPYQASPCNPNHEDLALFCGNDLVLQDTITVNQSQARYCQRYSPTELECFFRITRDLDLAIDVSGAEFPIMGNTDDVVNSLSQSEQIDDAQKVNEYVSWYLNGVTNAPEYGALNPNDPYDLFKIVNLTGPIKKLIPHRKQRDFIVETINSRDSDRHNQIVGCVYPWGQITECHGQLLQALAHPVRLSDWALNDHLPPEEEDYPNFLEWWRDYQEWRGQTCFTLPFIRIAGNPISFCFNDPTRPDYWGNLFFQIPLTSPETGPDDSEEDVNSSTEDRLGRVRVVQPVVQPVSPGLTITVNRLYTSPANLFFAHQEESNGLADILQSTFTPKGEEKTGPVSQVSPAEYCDLTRVRSNPGDDLFAGEIGVNVNYTADFSCGFEIIEPPDPVPSYWCNLYGGECVTDDYDCDTWFGRFGCPYGLQCGRDCDFTPPDQSCNVTAQVILNTVTETPLTDDIWSRLVAGSMGVFKRIFPKVEPGAPIEGILDIPGATGVNFSLVNPPVGVSLSVGNPSNQRSALELYFPHVGGIHEYFLKCIQQALRPEGFGEGCLSGAPPSPTACSAGGDIPTLPSAGGSCSLGSGGSLGLPSELSRAISAAAEVYHVPPSLILGIMFGEGAFNPGRYDWNNSNVQEWLREGACMPNCNPAVFPSQGVAPFLTQDIWNSHANAVRQIDPNRVPNPCNLLDVVFAMADTLRDGSAGYSGFAGYTCFGLSLNTGTGPGQSCSWASRDVETAIKVWESGYTINSGMRCWTAQNSCVLGMAGGACSAGNGDSCETITNRYAWPLTSHTGCVWNIYNQY